MSDALPSKLTAMTPKPERTVIAAAPGWYVAVYGIYCWGDGGDDYDGVNETIALKPVIGWAVTLDVVDEPRLGRMITKYEIEPILVGASVHEIDRLWALKRPDGLFEPIKGASPPFTEVAIRVWFREEMRRQGDPTLVDFIGCGTADKSPRGGQAMMAPEAICDHCKHMFDFGEHIVIGGESRCPRCASPDIRFQTIEERRNPAGRYSDTTPLVKYTKPSPRRMRT